MNTKNQSWIRLIAAFLFLAMLAACTDLTQLNPISNPPVATLADTAVPVQDTPASAQATPAPSSSGGLPSWLKVYFTNPNPPDQVGKGIDQYVVADLDKASKTIDLTSFDFTLPSVTQSLINANKRGVKVRMVLDEVNGSHELPASNSPDGKVFDALAAVTAARIPVIDGGRSNGLMHNKMIIIDSKILYMGSWNMSYNDTYRNNNNLLRITSTQIIANYQAKFNELFAGSHFGTKAQVGAQDSSLTVGSVQVENYFSPVDKVMDKLVAYVSGAKKSIRFIIFTYTDDNLANAMIASAKKGVNIQGVIENRGASQGALVPLFCAKNKNLVVKVDGNKYTMHHKVIVIDDSLVITGSFNFTKSADEANDDNVLVIHSPDVAALYLKEFQAVNALAKEPDTVDCTAK